jgi:hypothetical protein
MLKYKNIVFKSKIIRKKSENFDFVERFNNFAVK